MQYSVKLSGTTSSCPALLATAQDPSVPTGPCRSRFAISGSGNGFAAHAKPILDLSEMRLVFDVLFVLMPDSTYRSKIPSRWQDWDFYENLDSREIHQLTDHIVKRIDMENSTSVPSHFPPNPSLGSSVQPLTAKALRKNQHTVPLPPNPPERRIV
jgi:hypothetical protein